MALQPRTSPVAPASHSSSHTQGLQGSLQERAHSGVYDSAALSGGGKTAHFRSCRSHRGCRPEEDVAEKLDSANGVADRGDDRVQRLVPVDSLYVRIADGLEELRGSFYISLMPPVLATHQSRPLESRAHRGRRQNAYQDDALFWQNAPCPS